MCAALTHALTTVPVSPTRLVGLSVCVLQAGQETRVTTRQVSTSYQSTRKEFNCNEVKSLIENLL